MINFDQLKKAVTPKAAALRYDLRVGRSDMICCPFHDDRNPSLKLYDDHFFCYGCHKSGDVIDLVAGLFDLRPGEAAKKLAADFNIRMVDGVAKCEVPYTQTRQFQKDQNVCYGALANFIKYIDQKASSTTERDTLLSDQIKLRGYFEHLCELFDSGDSNKRAEIISALMPHLEALNSYTFEKNDVMDIGWIQ